MSSDHDDSCALVLQRLRTSMASVMPPGPLQTAVEELLDGVGQTFATTAPQNLLAVHVPLAFSKTEPIDRAEDLVGVAAACTAVYVGGRLLDDVLDGHDISYFERDQTPSDVLGWAALLAIVPPLILSSLGLDPESRLVIVNEFAAGMAAMASGQLRDAQPATSQLPSPDEAMLALRGKTGALVATFARASARATGLDEVSGDAAWRFGVGVGVARQLVLDKAKLHPDVVRRTDRQAPTYLVAAHGATLDGEEHRAFAALAARSRTSADARHELAEQVAASTAVGSSMLRAEFELAGAEAALGSLAVSDTTREKLQSMIDDASALLG